MKKTHFFILTALLLVTLRLSGQGVEDAIFNSQTYYEGTARSMAMGNATGAMGGDLTAACINPAGLGIYRSSELTFSTGIQQVFNQSSYYGGTQDDNRFRLNIPSIGFVMTAEASNYKPLRYLQFACSLTRTNDFNYKSVINGLNPSSSMVDAYLQTINGIDELFKPYIDPGNYLSDNYPYDLSPAWETYLIDRFIDSTGSYFFNSPVPQGDVWQNDVITSKGRSEEWTIALSANLYDKLFVGGSVGFNHLKRIQVRNYKETANDPSSDFFQWEHQQELGDTAWGVNAKLGVIYYPAQWVRVGLAWHSRSMIAIGELWSTETSSTLKNSPDSQSYHRYLSPTLYQSYDFHTPHTFIGSLAFFIGRHGLVTTDVEYMDYGSSRFSFDGVNDDIRSILKPTYNLRLGTEWRIRQFFARGGAAYYGSPYGFGQDYGSVKKLALGFGFAISDETSWDFAYELTETTLATTPYQYYVDGQNQVNDAIHHRWRNKVVVTMKAKL